MLSVIVSRNRLLSVALFIFLLPRSTLFTIYASSFIANINPENAKSFGK
jgi:hypothetical protein